MMVGAVYLGTFLCLALFMQRREFVVLTEGAIVLGCLGMLLLGLAMLSIQQTN